MFISQAFAQEAAAAAPQSFSFVSFVPLIAIFAIFYFLIIRPQSKKMKDHQELVNNLKTGNKIVTNGGIIGVVKEVLVKENVSLGGETIRVFGEALAVGLERQHALPAGLLHLGK
jgi:preprotein translocase subunit YajC